MGVKGLWSILLEDSSEFHDLNKYITEQLRNKTVSRDYCIGIDVGVWYYLCMTPFAVGHANRGENPELKTFFKKLLRLAKLPVHLIFVFDGPGRPKIKRDTRVVHQGMHLFKSMLLLIEAFGFEYHNAPGEAEAELGYMSQAGVIDLIITDDSDVALFGGRTIMRNWSLKRDKERVTIYSIDKASLSQDGMILFALIVTGDYNMEGLKGFGEGFAITLASYGFGERLCQLVRDLKDLVLTQAIFKWREEVHQFIIKNADGKFGANPTRLADKITNNFPNMAALQCYVSPVVSPFSLIESLGADTALPDIIKLTRLCELYFDWAAPDTIIAQAEKDIVAAIVMKTLSSTRDSGLVLSDKGDARGMTLSFTSELFPIGEFRVGKSNTMRALHYRQLHCPTQHLYDLILTSLRGTRTMSNSHRRKGTKKGKNTETRKQQDMAYKPEAFVLWVPTAVLEYLTQGCISPPLEKGKAKRVQQDKIEFKATKRVKLLPNASTSKSYRAVQIAAQSWVSPPQVPPPRLRDISVGCSPPALASSSVSQLVDLTFSDEDEDLDIGFSDEL